MNLNNLARRVAKLEGLKESVSIAQVKEVIRHTLNDLAKADPLDVLRLLQKRRCRR